MEITDRSIPPSAQIYKDQKLREEKRREVLAAVLRPLRDLIENITIESRAMSEERDDRGRLSMKVFEIANLGMADIETAKSWDVVLSVGHVGPLA